MIFPFSGNMSDLPQAKNLGRNVSIFYLGSYTLIFYLSLVESPGGRRGREEEEEEEEKGKEEDDDDEEEDEEGDANEDDDDDDEEEEEEEEEEEGMIVCRNLKMVLNCLKGRIPFKIVSMEMLSLNIEYFDLAQMRLVADSLLLNSSVIDLNLITLKPPCMLIHPAPL
eukprot:TRINITY_DN1659_c3_g1_i10.p2 TRINITY_DN1659_c3_g1~~TRINITY_DN1659_c3_g1_i10.p2  ORF type:complete len:168 (+),score=46.19 TRINITY_DN1659_c3_g1_i10:490-993(+)